MHPVQHKMHKTNNTANTNVCGHRNLEENITRTAKTAVQVT